MAASPRNQTAKKIPLLPLFSLVFFASILFLLSISRRSSLAPLSYHFDPRLRSELNQSSGSCNYADGSWVYDPDRSLERYDSTCKEIFKGWNCIASGKTNARDIPKWRWQPKGCNLPHFDPLVFLETYRDTNPWDVKMAISCRWSADPKGGELESLGYKEGYRVDVDIPESTWENAPSFHDIVIFNTGHWWWAPSKFDPVKTPMLFYRKGVPIIPPVSPDVGLDMVLENMVHFVEDKMRPGGIKFFRTQSPRHFEGGDWNEGGSCLRKKPLLFDQAEQLFGVRNNGTNVEARLVNQHILKVVKWSSFQILDITHLSELRADGHPANAGGKKHDDCMHWCLPGVTDTWNDLFILQLQQH
ncbi:Protein trichome birefringence-like 13 [Linum perenne]